MSMQFERIKVAGSFSHALRLGTCATSNHAVGNDSALHTEDPGSSHAGGGQHFFKDLATSMMDTLRPSVPTTTSTMTTTTKTSMDIISSGGKSP